MVLLLAVFCFDKERYQVTMGFKGNNSSIISDTNRPPVSHNMLINSTLRGPVAFSLNATDPDKGDTLTFAIVAKPVLGNISSFDPSSGGGVYAPGEDMMAPSAFEKQDSFAFNAIDSNGRAGSAATVTIVLPG
jgi:Bacterial Ig domain